MKEIGAYEAKTKLSQLLHSVLQGKEFIITNHGRPVARLTPIGEKKNQRAPSEVIRDLMAFKPKRNCSDLPLKKLIQEGRP